MTSPARPSATVCCFRANPTQVLMVQRSESARFMGGAWVFPGGAVDAIDRDPESLRLLKGVPESADQPWVLAAARELVEEVGIWLTSEPFSNPRRLLDQDVYDEARRRGLRFDGGRLAYFANWITPTLVPVRFDARFYAAVVPDGIVPYPDASEIAAATWIEPGEALRRGAAGEMVIPFPTMKTLEQLDEFESVADLLDHVRSLPRVPPIQPRMRVGSDGVLEVVLPGEPGFDEIDDSAGPDPDALRRAAEASSRTGHQMPEAGV